VTTVATSITGFMVEEYGRGRSRSLPPRRDDIAGRGMSAEDKRALSGRITAIGLVAKTNEKIIKGLQALREAGARMTQGALAAAAGISLRTVKARWDWIRQGCKPVPASGIAAPAADDAATPGPGSGGADAPTTHFVTANEPENPPAPTGGNLGHTPDHVGTPDEAEAEALSLLADGPVSPRLIDYRLCTALMGRRWVRLWRRPGRTPWLTREPIVEITPAGLAALEQYSPPDRWPPRRVA
jgi:hypothetical protein